MEANGWLKVVVEQMQEDLAELKTDVKLLLEERAISKGKMYMIGFLFGVVGAVSGVGVQILAAWFKTGV